MIYLFGFHFELIRDIKIRKYSIVVPRYSNMSCYLFEIFASVTILRLERFDINVSLRHSISVMSEGELFHKNVNYYLFITYSLSAIKLIYAIFIVFRLSSLKEFYVLSDVLHKNNTLDMKQIAIS